MRSNAPTGRSGAGHRRAPAFTLIELIIVVAIIALLVAIAVPNFLEAQARAKLSRVRGDMRTIATGLAAYRIDYENFPPAWYGEPMDAEFSPITTPIAYLTSLPADPFRKRGVGSSYEAKWTTYDYIRYQPGAWATLLVYGPIHSALDSEWAIVSGGPDRVQESYYNNYDIPAFSFLLWSYDPSNGTVSRGDIYRTSAGFAL